MCREAPNVLMICTDHWPASLMGCAGRNDIMTPTLDSLAQAGVRFDQFYTECPVCIPARRTLMTGLYPKTHGDRVYSDRMPMPHARTLAKAFGEHGYQTIAVGKLHVFPQRDRIGFDDVILMEEGRYALGDVDDYQVWLGEKGYCGQEFLHGMGNNTYYTRPWHLPEETHPTNWTTTQMMKQIKRKDPTRPAFFFCSYVHPHPPLTPLPVYWDMYADAELAPPVQDEWHDGAYIWRALGESSRQYGQREALRARRAFFAQCTHIDHQLRLLIGTLRECGLLDNTIIVFTSDHGDMLFDHGLVGKRVCYEGAAKVPLIWSGKPMERYCGVNHKLSSMADLMPTLLSLCGVPVPETVEGIDLFSEQEHAELYCEISEGEKATRMLRWQDYKLIYYPCGNVLQLFDLQNDPDERHDCAGDAPSRPILEKLMGLLIARLYGADRNWLRDGRLVGFAEPIQDSIQRDYGLSNQRGYHWPPPILRQV